MWSNQLGASQYFRSYFQLVPLLSLHYSTFAVGTDASPHDLTPTHKSVHPAENIIVVGSDDDAN